MKSLLRIPILAFAIFVFATSLWAQTPAPSCTLPLDFCESAWTVSVWGNYSAMNNANTNNGFESGAAFRFSTHWSAAARYYQTASPSGNVFVAGPEFHFSPAHFLSSSPISGFDWSNVEIGVHASPGIAWSTANITNDDGTTVGVSGPKRFAFAVGGMVDYTFPSAPNFQLRILEVSYVRAPFLSNGGQLIGNHVQVASGIKLVFGGLNSPQAAARSTQRKLKKQLRDEKADRLKQTLN